jgi:hypothetical protein
MEWQRVYYKMGIAISSNAQLEMELNRAKILGFDMLKSYVRMPDIQQRHIVEFAHSIGVPASSHEVYPFRLQRHRQYGTYRRHVASRLFSQDDAGPQLWRCLLDPGRGAYDHDAHRLPTMRDFLAGEPGMRNRSRLALEPPWLKAQILNAPPHLDHPVPPSW